MPAAKKSEEQENLKEAAAATKAMEELSIDPPAAEDVEDEDDAEDAGEANGAGKQPVPNSFLQINIVIMGHHSISLSIILALETSLR